MNMFWIDNIKNLKEMFMLVKDQLMSSDSQIQDEKNLKKDEKEKKKFSINIAILNWQYLTVKS